MVEEGNLALVRSQKRSASSASGPDSAKDELQQRMEVARESISHTVDEIKDTMVNQYESVKDSVSKTLDWHEQVKRRPIAWGAGALGAGFVVGYGVAAVVKGPGKISMREYSEAPASRTVVKARAASQSNAAPGFRPEQTEDSGAGLIDRIKDTPAFDRVKNEAGIIGNRFVDEISKKAQEVVLPAAVALIGSWLERLIPSKKNQPKPAGI